MYGIEINPYAHELAQVTVWIGYLQWMRDNGFAAPRDPIQGPRGGRTLSTREGSGFYQMIL